jgi:glycosyltransferase involved in cell wall biosynthesis
MMKILFLTKSLKFPSARVRIIDLLPFLKDAGFDCQPETIPKNPFKRVNLFKSAKNYSAVVLQKQLISQKDLLTLRKYAKLLIYDFDDTVYLNHAYPSEKPEKYQNQKNLKRFTSIIQVADHTVAANTILAKFAENRLKNSTISTIPSSVRTEHDIKNDYNISDTPVIGWIGTKENLPYLKYIAPALQAVASKKKFLLRIISNGTIKIPGIETEYRQWNLTTQYNEIRQFDIGIMPLQLNPYSKGKSAYKLLQYMNIGIPSVASAIGINREISKNDKYCLLAENNDIFAKKILLLINNIELRKSIGEKGRKLVTQQFDIKNAAETWSKMLTTLLIK